jgi:hypothetical protein
MKVVVAPSTPQVALRDFIDQRCRGRIDHMADLPPLLRAIPVMEIQEMRSEVTPPTEFTSAVSLFSSDDLSVYQMEPVFPLELAFVPAIAVLHGEVHGFLLG